MTSVGRLSRLSRFFRSDSKSTLIVAIDHGRMFGPLRGIENVAHLVEIVMKNGADGVMMTPGLAKEIMPLSSIKGPLLIRIDGSATVIGPNLSDDRLISRVETAVRMDAAAVVLMAYVGCQNEPQLLSKVGQVADDCEEWGIPLMAEMLPGEVIEYHFKKSVTKVERRFDPENVIIAARVGAELGADIIKTYYTGDEETYRRVIRGCPVPVVFTGGPETASIKEWFLMLKEAVRCGARGATIGRNIWQSENPAGMTRAIAGIIHHGASVEDALEEIASN